MASPVAGERSLLADLRPDVREALAALDGPPIGKRAPGEQLAAVFAAGTPYEFTAGAVRVLTDGRWFTTLPAGGDAGPFLELRRWPGDTVLALYALAGSPESGRTGPPLDRAALTADPARRGSWAVWRGTLGYEVGDRPALWLERAVGGEGSRLAALLLPGDAGLGSGAVADLTHELLAVVDRIEVREEGWRVMVGIAPGTPVEAPFVPGAPGQADESRAPWQVVLGNGYTLGLPPGFRARRLDGALVPPVDVAGATLWVRGRCIDLQGERIVVGDGTRSGYVADVRPVTRAWSSGRLPPLGVASAKAAGGEEFPLAADRADAVSARAERWSEEGFEGEWLLFRLVFEDRGVEIGLPVLEGRRSPTLFWIPVTFRGPGKAPAPPPVDPAERFGIRFEQLRPAEQQRHPWTQGRLRVPGLVADVPKDWFPSASLRSRDGYPIRFLRRGGESMAELDRIAGAEVPKTGAEWSEQERLGGIHAERVVRSIEGGTYVFVPKEGTAFRFELLHGERDSRQSWERMMRSVQLLRGGS